MIQANLKVEHHLVVKVPKRETLLVFDCIDIHVLQKRTLS
jgi:hypothetical protein